MALLLALLRTPGRLTRVESELTDTGWSLRSVPHADNDAVAAAWSALAQARWGDEAVAALVRQILQTTHPDPRAAAQPFVPPLPPEPPPRATAAHPRAFRGTLRQPPKPPSVPAVDLQPALASAAGSAQLARQLGLGTPPVPCGSVKYQLSLGLVAPIGWMSLYQSLRLDEKPKLRAALTRLAFLHPHPNGLAWATSLMTHPRRRRTALLDALLKRSSSLPDYPGGDLLHLLAQQSRYANRLPWFLDGLERGVDPSRIRLALEFLAHQESLDPLPAGGIADAAHLRETLQRIPRWFRPYYLRRPELADPFWSSLSEKELDGAYYLLDRAPLGRVRAVLEGVPRDFWMKAWWALEELEEPLWDNARPLLARLCSAPHPTAPRLSSQLLDFWMSTARLAPDLRRRIVALPDATFLLAEKHARRRSAEELLCVGLGSLLNLDPALTVELLERWPRALFGRVGTLALPHADLERRSEGAWRQAACQRPDASLSELAEELGELAAHRIPPRLLRGAGRPADLETLAARRPLIRFDVLLLLTQRMLCAEFGWQPDEAALHAAGMAGRIRHNRAPLRRYLRKLGQRSQEQLPANRKWLQAHPSLNAELWRRGLERTTHDVPGAPITLKLEEDPLEVLQLGTRVDSCLALGGMLEDSAAACVLDVNKRVVYARDASGRIVARQLLALSEKLRLVCYEVYPLDRPHWLRSLFVDYATELALALGVERETEEYGVARLASDYFWDDGLMDPA